MRRTHQKNADILEAGRDDSARYYFAVRDTDGQVISTPGRDEQRALKLALDEFPSLSEDDLMRVPEGWTAENDRKKEGSNQ